MPRASDEDKSKKIFVGGLHIKTDDRTLQQYFQRYGELTDCIVMKYPNTQRSRGFGFITYRDATSVEDCFSSGPHQIDGKDVEIKRAVPKDASGRDGDDEEEGLPPNHRLLRKLFIGGLDRETTESEMQEYFEQFGSLEECTIMKFNESGRSRGFGFVTFADADSVDTCQRARPHRLRNRELDCKRATPRSQTSNPEAQVSVKKLFVGGIREDITDEDIREYFSAYGNVLNVEQMVRSDTGMKRGFGFVEFDDTDTVDKICILGRHSIKGKKVDVKKALSKMEMDMMKAAGKDKGGRGGRGRDRDDYMNNMSPMMGNMEMMNMMKNMMGNMGGGGMNPMMKNMGPDMMNMNSFMNNMMTMSNMMNMWNNMSSMMSMGGGGGSNSGGDGYSGGRHRGGADKHHGGGDYDGWRNNGGQQSGNYGGGMMQGGSGSMNNSGSGGMSGYGGMDGNMGGFNPFMMMSGNGGDGSGSGRGQSGGPMRSSMGSSRDYSAPYSKHKDTRRDW